MMLLRLGVARAASKRPASLSAGAPAATGNTTPLRRSLDRLPRAAATPSPEAPSEPTRGSSSPPAASGGGGPSLPAAPSAMAGRVSGSQAGDGGGVQPLGNRALSTRRRPRQTLFHHPPAAASFWRRGIAGIETSSGFSPGGRQSAGGRRGCREEDELERRGEKQRGVSETGGRRPLYAKQKARGARPGGLRGRDAHGLSGAGAGRPQPAHPPPARGQRRSCPRKRGGSGGSGGSLHSTLL